MSIYRDGIYGVAIGDALGVPFEFKSREAMRRKPAYDMCGHGTHNQPKGTWSDDTSMTIATAWSIGEKGGIDYEDIMENFSQWLHNDKFTATGKTFDAGITTSMAIRFHLSGRPAHLCGGTDKLDNGNGGLMRILPACLYVIDKEMDDKQAVEVVQNVCSLTHAHKISLDACLVYYYIVKEIITNRGELDENITDALQKAKRVLTFDFERFSELDVQLLKGMADDRIISGGYVIDTLVASVWCLLNTSNYSECVLKAVNLGYDTDTTAAVAGGLAGIYYGLSNVPQTWFDVLKGKDLLEETIAMIERV